MIQAGIELFSTVPYEDVSVDDLARRAQVAHGTISYHFGNKRRLFADTVTALWDEFVQFTRPRAGELTPSQVVRGYIERQFEYVRLHPDRYTLMQSTHADKEISGLLDEMKTEATTKIMNSLGCPSDPPPLLAEAVSGWSGFVKSVSMLWMSDPTQDVHVLAEMCLQVLVAAVSAAQGVRIDANVEEHILGEVARPREVSSGRSQQDDRPTSTGTLTLSSAAERSSTAA